MNIRPFIVGIKTILDELAGHSDSFPLAEVNAYTKKEGWNLPAIDLFVKDEIEINRQDNISVEIVTPVTALLLFPNKDGEKAELARLDVLDAVLNKLNERATLDALNCLVDIWEITGVQRVEYEQPEPLTGFEITITGRKLLNFT